MRKIDSLTLTAAAVCAILSGRFGYARQPDAAFDGNGRVDECVAIDAVARLVWGKAASRELADRRGWRARAEAAQALATEVPFAGAARTVWVVIADDVNLAYDAPAGKEILTRRIIGYVDADSAVVLKLLVLSPDPADAHPLAVEPTVPDLVEDLARSAETWIEPVSPDHACLIDALETIFRRGLGATTLRHASRVVVNVIRSCSDDSTRFEPLRPLWSVDFRDGVLSPRGPHGRPITHLRYILDIRASEVLRATNRPAMRGAREAGERSDREFAEKIRTGQLVFMYPGEDDPGPAPAGGARSDGSISPTPAAREDSGSDREAKIRAARTAKPRNPRATGLPIDRP